VLTAGLLLAAVLVVVALPMAGSPPADQITGWRGAPLAAFVFPLIGFCIAPVYPAINSIVLSALPARQHAPMAGLIVVFSALGGTSGSMITGLMFEQFDGRIAFYFSLLPITAILFSLYLFKRKTLEMGVATDG
jgi:fucose permease